MNLVRTTRTYKTVENATQALDRAMGGLNESDRYLIAVAPDGRYAPVLVGERYIPFAHLGITIVA